MRSIIIVFILLRASWGYTQLPLSHAGEANRTTQSGPFNAAEDFGQQMEEAFRKGFKDFGPQMKEAFRGAFAPMGGSSIWAQFDESTTLDPMVYDSSLTDAERQFLLQTLQETADRFQMAVMGLTPAQLAFKIAPEKWSILEVMEHIAVTQSGIFSLVKGQLQKPHDPARRQEIKVADQEIIPRLTNRSRKAQAPEPVVPQGRFANADQAQAAFRLQHEQIVQFVQTSQANLRERYWQHPATGVVDLYQTLLLIAGHTQRHLLQLAEIKQAPGYPE